MKKKTPAKKTKHTSVKKQPAKSAGNKNDELIKFLQFLQKNHSDAVAKEGLKNARELDIPILKLFAQMPEEALLAQSKKGLDDHVASLIDGTYLEKQKKNLELWEQDKLPGISRDSISPSDLVLIYVSQRRTHLKFLPLYTNKLDLALMVIQQSDNLNLQSQEAAVNLMFRLSKEMEEKAKRDAERIKESEEQLKKTNDFLDSVLENIPNMVFVKDARDLRFIRFNKAGEKLLGVSRKDLIGKSDFDFFPKEQAEFFTGKDRTALQGDGVTDIAEEPINAKNGQRWLHTRKIPVKDDKGKPLYLVGISEDITEKRKIDEQMRMLNHELAHNIIQLETVNKELEAFSYSVSHDLRSPLRAINGYTKILLNDYASAIDDDGRQMMQAVMNNTIKMGQLIDDLLAFSRLGKKEMNIMEVDMEELAKVALQEIRAFYPEINKTHITINKLHSARADYTLMEQVFANLISNAIKYSGKVDKPVVDVSSYQKNGENIYCVKDNGVGFDMKYYDKLFGVFQRLHSQAEFDGTGVGLALVKRIVSRHGGRVWAEAEPGKGASFYVALSNESK